MFWTKLAKYTADSIALLSAAALAVPFALVIGVPVLGSF